MSSTPRLISVRLKTASKRLSKRNHATKVGITPSVGFAKDKDSRLTQSFQIQLNKIPPRPAQIKGLGEETKNHDESAHPG